MIFSAMSNMSTPAGAQPPTQAINTAQIGSLIRYWAHWDSVLSDLNKQARNAREQRAGYEGQVLNMLRAANMVNPVIQIGGGTRLVIGHERHQTPLSYRTLEEYLTAYYRSKQGSRDETKDILKFIRSSRQSSVTQCLKRQHAGSTPRVKDKEPNST